MGPEAVFPFEMKKKCLNYLIVIEAAVQRPASVYKQDLSAQSAPDILLFHRHLANFFNDLKTFRVESAPSKFYQCETPAIEASAL